MQDSHAHASHGPTKLNELKACHRCSSDFAVSMETRTWLHALGTIDVFVNGHIIRVSVQDSHAHTSNRSHYCKRGNLEQKPLLR